MSLGSRIRQARKQAGLSQAELGRMLGLSSQAVSQWETGKTIPESDRLADIARLTDVHSGWLIDGDDISQPIPIGKRSEFGGRVVPKIDWSELDRLDELDLSNKPVGFSTFECGPRSVQVIVRDRANATLTNPEQAIFPGDAAIIDPDEIPKPGDLIALRLEDEVMIRQFKPRFDHVELVPLNSDWKDYRIPSLTPEILIGVIVETHRRRRR